MFGIFASFSSAFSLLAVTKTLKSLDAKCSAITSPIPLDAPVIRTLLFLLIIFVTVIHSRDELVHCFSEFFYNFFLMVGSE